MLKRQLGLWQAVMLGLGIMIGAGIYVLVGVAGVEAGPALWLSFAIAAVISLFTALTYAELSSMYPVDGSSYLYSKRAIGSRTLSFLLGWFIVVAYAAGAATVSMGFGQYLQNILPIPVTLGATALLVFLGLLNYNGMRYVTFYSAFGTLVSVIALLSIIGLFLNIAGPGGLSFSFTSPKGMGGILSGALLAVFAFFGFEALTNAAEEIKDPRRNLPRAILISLVIVTAVYMLISIAFTAALPYEKIVATVTDGKGSLAVAAEAFGGPAFSLIVIIGGLLSTSSTVVVVLMGISRLMYGMAEDHALPKRFLSTNKSGVPGLAVLIATIFSICLVFYGDLGLVARLAVSAMFVLFIFDNLSLIRLRLASPKLARPFRIPLSIANVPITSVLAILFMSYLLIYEFMSYTNLFMGLLVLTAIGLVLNKAEYWLTRD
ncbi:MAG: amino acid permease [Candidatus Micrarchaeia archaeon]|jgi:APA family basic amino acid/polyamine antiporter